MAAKRKKEEEKEKEQRKREREKKGRGKEQGERDKVRETRIAAGSCAKKFIDAHDGHAYCCSWWYGDARDDGDCGDPTGSHGGPTEGSY